MVQDKSWSSFNPVRSWYATTILTALFAISYLDRYILVLLAVDVSKDLQLTDVEFGLIIGAGFAFVYAIGGLLVAQAIDRFSRKWILIAGVVTWSAMTILSGFADSFGALLICRGGVALGEAVLMPAAVSLIADFFPPERRAAPNAVYSSASSVMSKGSFLIGAGVMAIATPLAITSGFAVWQLTLFIVGVPGVLLAALMAVTVREPDRSGTARSDSPSLSAFRAYLGENWKFYLPFYLGTTALATFAVAAVSWTPALLIRSHDLTASRAGMLIGIVGVIGGIGGSFLWPYLGRAISRATGREGLILAPAIAGTTLTIAAVFGYGSNALPAMLAGIGLAQFSTAAIGVMGPLAIQIYGPSRMRAKLTAIMLMGMHLVGSVCGPLLVPWIAAQWPDDPFALGYAIAWLGGVLGPFALTAFLISRRFLMARADAPPVPLIADGGPAEASPTVIGASR